MSSQKSTAAPAAREPKRDRGRIRVAAIMDAGMAVFADRGYDAATMTEIAARSGTAIGSLYRFFPTKEALADALLARFGERMGRTLAEIARRAAGLPPAALADELVDLMLDLKVDRAAVVALVDARTDAADTRTMFRDGVRRHLAAVLAAANAKLSPAETEARAAVLLQLLKAVPALAREDATARTGLVAEMRTMVRLCVCAPSGD
jgi:AcrR family transcriptional regulator